MEIETIQDVAILFGSPLAFEPEPIRPFKLKTWHVVAGGVTIILLICGTLYIYDHVKDKFSSNNGTASQFKNYKSKKTA